MKVPRRNRSGFTAIEMVVSLAIIVLIGSQVMISFSGLGQGVALNRAAREIVGEIRKAQYASLAVTYAHLPVGSVPAFVVPPAIGVRLDTTTPQQTLRFADRGNETCPPGCPTPDFPNPPDGTYSDSRERIATYALPGAIKIRKITDQTSASYTIVHILFQTPEATLTFTKDDGTPIPGNRLDIELTGGNGAKKTLTVHITGEINVP